jgi:hypothetical protein
MFWVFRKILSLDLSSSPTSSLLLKGIMGSSRDLSYLLSLQEAVVMLTRKKMSRHLYMVALFRDGLIGLVAILSGRIYEMIRLVVSLSSRISSLPPISMSFIS